MSIHYSRVDEDGFFIGDVWLDHVPDPDESPYLIADEVPSGFYHPRWNGTEWVEGMSQEDIDDLINIPKPVDPGAIMGERIVQLELENLSLKQQNEVLGSSLIDFELRLLHLEGGNV